MKIEMQKILSEITRLFAASGMNDSAKEAEALIAGILCIDKSALYSGVFDPSDEQLNAVNIAVERRLRGEPLQYITGYTDFLGLKIKVGDGVLIPRPETELLTEKVIDHIKKRVAPVSVLDLCTGSGCIALAIAKHCNNAEVRGVDRSEAALEYAVRNAESNNIPNAGFLRGDLFAPVESERFDVIVSNPPYIRTKDIASLQREIRDYEPLAALDGGEDGLVLYRRIFSGAKEHLKSGGLLALEIGYDQSEDVRKSALVSGFTDMAFYKDYSGIERIFWGFSP